MLSSRKNIRVWNITVTWKNHTQTLRKEFIITAPDNQTARQLVNNRLPNSVLNQPAKEAQVRIRDLGNIENEKTYFSSDPFVPNTRQDDAPQYERVLLYARMWGSELGWRSTNQAATQQDDAYLQKMKNENDLIPMLTDWANQSMYSINQTPEEFFLTKMSDYLGTKVINITDMIPVSEQGYDKLIKTAELKAQQIIYDAKQKADQIEQHAHQIEREAQRDKQLVEKMLNALQAGITPQQTSVPSAPLLDKCQVSETDNNTQNEEPSQPEPKTDPENAPEEPSFDPENDQDSPNTQNDSPETTDAPINDTNWSEPTDDTPEVISDTTSTIESTFEDIPDMSSAQNVQEQTKVQNEQPMIPPILKEEEYSIDDEFAQPIEGIDDVEEVEADIPEPAPEEPPQPPVVVPTKPPKKQISPMTKSSDQSDDALVEIMKHWQLEKLKKPVNRMTIELNNDQRRPIHQPAMKMWKSWFSTALENEYTKQQMQLTPRKIETECFLEFIRECDPMGDLTPIQYVYSQCTGQTIKFIADKLHID